MEYQAPGRTGFKVSALGFGGAPIGIPDCLSDDDHESEAFRAAAIAATSSRPPSSASPKMRSERPSP